MRDVNNPVLFEVAWEVANKVGGIYTVIRTKVPVTVAQLPPGQFFCLGPLVSKSANIEVEFTPAEDPVVRSVIDVMATYGARCVHGRWLIEGAPNVVLFDLDSVRSKMAEWRHDLWENARVPSPPDDWETNDAILLGYIVAWFMEEFLRRDAAEGLNRAVVGHFHEWQAGVGLILARKRGLDCATVFTTHATLLGRYLCAGDVDFYNNLRNFDVDAEAGRRQIYHRYCLERAAAHCADVFTTVSHITAFEAEHLLKRKPDGVLPNGLNVVKFSAVHEFQNLHAVNKAKIHNFVRGHFYGHYDFDLDNTLYFFTAGRYEFRNKGVDMYLESLARLNYRLKEAKSPMTVVAFIIMPAPTHSFTVETLKGQAVVKQLRETVDEIHSNIGTRMFEQALKGKEIDWANLFSEQEKVMLKRRMYALSRHSLPPIVTHNMTDDSNNQILNAIRRLGLFNHPDDRVKVVYHPEFLNASNPVLGLDYEDFIRGTHLGVFPSYYEPWGYTPAECTVMGVPSITTNLSGFGCFMEDCIEQPEDYGIYIVDRRLKSAEESIDQLANQMFTFCCKTRRQRINQRNRTERLSGLLDWKRMGLEYVRARRLALRRVYPDSFPPSGENDTDEDEYSDNRSESSEHQPGRKVPPPRSLRASPRLGAASEDETTTDDPVAFMDRLSIGHSMDDDDTRHVGIPLKQGGTIPPDV